MALTLNGTTGIVTPGVTDTGDLSVAGTTALTTPLPVTSGGTGATSLSGITTGTATNLAGGSAGTVPYQSASGTTAMLSAGTSGQVLTSSGAGAPSWSSTLVNPTISAYTETPVSLGTVTSTATLIISAGTVITATLTASTACTFTMPTATAGKSFILLLKQAASTGNGTATFTGVKWGSSGAPTITATAGKMDILTFVADGTNWYGNASQGYTP